MQTNTRTQPAFRAAYPASLAILAAAGDAARTAAEFRSKHGVDDGDLPVLTALGRRVAGYLAADQARRAPVAARRLDAMGGVA